MNSTSLHDHLHMLFLPLLWQVKTSLLLSKWFYVLHTDGNPLCTIWHISRKKGCQWKRVCSKLHLGCGCAHNGPVELFEFCCYAAVLDYLNEKISQFTFSTKIYWRTKKGCSRKKYPFNNNPKITSIFWKMQHIIRNMMVNIWHIVLIRKNHRFQIYIK